MKKYIIILIAALTGMANASAQPKLTLEDCYSSAETSYPLSRQIPIEGRISSLKISNLNTKYYPELSVTGQAQYQSDVTKLPFDFSKAQVTDPQYQPLLLLMKNLFNAPDIPKDQYRIGLNINQTIWDGGAVSSQKDIEYVQGDINRQNLQVELYKLRQRVNDAYFALLILQQRQNSLDVLLSDLNEKLGNIRVMVENGALLQSNADVLEAETIKARQNIEEVKAQKRTALRNLSELINRDIDENTVLVQPETMAAGIQDAKWNRPEYKLFSLSKEQADRAKELSNTKNMPKFSAYAQAMYAKPGLNMFDPDFAPFYIVGVKASWNLWDWNTSSREKEMLELQKEIIGLQEEAFTKNTRIASEKYLSDIDRLKNLMESDRQIIDIRKRIVDQAFSQLQNGAITSTEYVTELNSKSQAELSLETHRIELLQANVNYLTLVGANIAETGTK